MANIPTISVYPDAETLEKIEELKAQNPDKSLSSLIVDLINTSGNGELKNKTIGSRIEESKLTALEVKAKLNGKTISAVLQDLIDDFLTDSETPKESKKNQPLATFRVTEEKFVLWERFKSKASLENNTATDIFWKFVESYVNESSDSMQNDLIIRRKDLIIDTLADALNKVR